MTAYRINTELTCKHSGLPIGNLIVEPTAGTLPWVSHWNEMVCYHPVFGMSAQKLFDFTESEWKRLAQKAADDETSESEANVLRVCYLAMLHTLDSVKQDCPALPPLHIVQNTIARLSALARWKWLLESKRLKFPTLHISALNGNTGFSDIGEYLNICFKIKADYETKLSDTAEKAKAKAADDAIKALNSEWINPVSRKVLWRWVRSNLPEKYQPDAQGWLGTLFLGGSAAIVEFDKDEIQQFQEIIEAECPAGTGIMPAVRARLEEVMKVWEQHHEAFEIDLADYADGSKLLVNGERVAATDPGPEPIEKDFATKTKFIVAHAKWKLNSAAWEKQNGKD